MNVVGDWSKMEPVKIADREQMAAAIGTSCYICHEDKHGKEAATLGMVRRRSTRAAPRGSLHGGRSTRVAPRVPLHAGRSPGCPQIFFLLTCAQY